MRSPTKEESDSPLFNAIWGAIRGWDIRRDDAAGYASATGTDACAIMDAIIDVLAQRQAINVRLERTADGTVEFLLTPTKHPAELDIRTVGMSPDTERKVVTRTGTPSGYSG